MSSLISSSVRPLVRAARTCMASSSWCPRAIRAVRVIIERLRRSRPGRVQMPPQAYSVMNSWNSRVRSVALAVARSTWASPSTSRRTAMPGDIGARRPAAPRPARAGGSARRPRRVPRRARGGRRRRARRSGRPSPARRSRAASRAASATSAQPATASTGAVDLAEPVAHVEVGERLADLDVALVVGVLERVQQRRRRAPARGRGSRARTSVRRTPTPSPRCPRR